jgi:hypothetical protein
MAVTSTPTGEAGLEWAEDVLADGIGRLAAAVNVTRTPLGIFCVESHW